MRAHLMMLDVDCPNCGTRPNIRIMQSLVDMVESVDPDQVLGTWGCQGKRCSETIIITAGMIRRATVPGGKTA